MTHDLDDPLEDLLALPAGYVPTPHPLSADVPAPVEPTTYREPCPKGCRNGRFISYAGRDCGPCHHCKGRGYVEFRTSPEARQAVRERSAARKQSLAEESFGRFKRDNPAEADWIVAEAPRFDFARSMKEAVEKYGELTERQIDAIRRCMAKNAARAEAQAQTAAIVGQIDVTNLNAAFDRAKANGAKKASLRAGTVIFSLAPATGTNPGALYVKRTEGNVYLGKITGPTFKPSFSCTPADVQSIQSAAVDPLETALQYARDNKGPNGHGICAICGAELTNPESIARGIGPICAGKFGW